MEYRMKARQVLALAVLAGVAGLASAHEDKFRTMDANGDGKLTAAEHAAGAKAMFERMDANHDGNVTAAEMDAGRPMMRDRADDMHGMQAGEKARSAQTQAMPGKPGAGMTAPAASGMPGAGMGHGMGPGMGPGMMMSAADRIASMDSNRDGMLSAAEHEAGAAAMFRQMDSDGDGSLTRDEMAAGHARRMQAPAGAPATQPTDDSKPTGDSQPTDDGGSTDDSMPADDAATTPAPDAT